MGVSDIGATNLAQQKETVNQRWFLCGVMLRFGDDFPEMFSPSAKLAWRFVENLIQNLLELKEKTVQREEKKLLSGMLKKKKIHS